MGEAGRRGKSDANVIGERNFCQRKRDVALPNAAGKVPPSAAVGACPPPPGSGFRRRRRGDGLPNGQCGKTLCPCVPVGTHRRRRPSRRHISWSGTRPCRLVRSSALGLQPSKFTAARRAAVACPWDNLGELARRSRRHSDACSSRSLDRDNHMVVPVADGWCVQMPGRQLVMLPSRLRYGRSARPLRSR